MNQIGAWLNALYRVLTLEKGIFFNLVGRQRGLRTYLMQIHLPNTADLPKVLKAHESLAMAMGVEHVRVARNKALVDIDVPLPEDSWRSVKLSQILSSQAERLTLGHDSGGQVATISLQSPLCANVLFAGMPGSGKTFSMISLVFQCAVMYDPQDLQIILIDLKNDRAWKPLHMLPHLAHPPVKTEQEARQVLEWVRDQRLERIHYNGQKQFPRLLVVIDEIASLIMRAGKEGALAKLIGESTGQGRALGINLFLGTQQPNQKTMGAFTNADMHVRIVGRVTSADYAAHATGRPQTGAEHLCGKGDMLAFFGNEIRHITTLYLDRDSLKQLPKKIEPEPLLLPAFTADAPEPGGRDTAKIYSPEVIKKTALALYWFFKWGKRPTANSLQSECKGSMTNSRIARNTALDIIKQWPEPAEVFVRNLMQEGKAT